MEHTLKILSGKGTHLTIQDELITLKLREKDIDQHSNLIEEVFRVAEVESRAD